MITLHRTEQEKAQLIAKYVARDPRRPGLYDAYLSDYGVSIWVIISRLETVNHGDIDEAAADYDLPREAVEAAFAFYEQHAAAIDARIEAQNAQFS